MSFLNKWILIFSFIPIIIGISACTQNSDILSSSSEESVNEKIIQEGSCVMTYLEDIDSYTAASICMKNGSYLKISAKSLIPPAELKGTDVGITMAYDWDKENNELIFTFGPHGCEFSEPAKLCLSWKELNTNNATLYYLDEKGNHVEQLPDQIDTSKKRMCLDIKHFSRYAVAYSN